MPLEFLTMEVNVEDNVEGYVEEGVWISSPKFHAHYEMSSCEVYRGDDTRGR